MNRCRYFNGISNERCQAGIKYTDLLGDGPGWAAHMPCLRDDNATVVCGQASFPSEDEARRDVDEREARIVKFLEELNNGICPICKVQVQQRQVGPCVYGTCGHRLYQGSVNPKFKAA